MTAALIVAGICVVAIIGIMVAMHFGWAPTIKVGSGGCRESNALATGCLGPFVAIGMIYVLIIGAVSAFLVAGMLWLIQIVS